MLVADGDHAIACGEQHITGLVFEKADAASEKIAAAFPDPGPGTLESGDIGDSSGGDEFRNGLRSARVAGLHPEQESGFAARLENLRGALNLGLRARAGHNRTTEGLAGIAFVGGQTHIAWQREEGCAGAARFRRAHRLAEEFTELRGSGDFGSVFGHRPQQ
jgi:hypothetical protein